LKKSNSISLSLGYMFCIGLTAFSDWIELDVFTVGDAGEDKDCICGDG